MITLFSGVPGSGKTYKMVAELSRCKDKYFVVHNIDGLQDGYLGNYGLNFIEYCKENNLEVPDFFSKEFQIEFTQKIRDKYNRPVLCVIDEAHEWFSTNSKALKMWLSYHRHLDQQIWLVAHRSTNLPSVYRSFIEVEYRAKSGSFLGIPGFFFYNRLLGGVAAGYVKERKSQKIFKIYKSALASSDVNRKKPKMLYVMIAGAVALVAAFIAIPYYILKPDAPAAAHQKATPNAQGAAPLPGASDPVAAFVNQKNTEGKIKAVSLSEKYAYVGNFAGRIVLEDRKTGEHKYIEKMSEGLKVVSVSGSDSCVVLSSSGPVVTLYNEGRFQPTENSGRPLSKGFSVGDETSSSSPGFVPSSISSSHPNAPIADHRGR